jgi:sugar phosphate isomerase/epimerase
MHPPYTSRREILGLTASMLFATKSWADDSAPVTSSTTSEKAGCTLGFSTYGMETLTTEDAIDAIAKIGFDSLELAVRIGTDADSASVTRLRRQSLRNRIIDSSLRLTSLMEHVTPTDAKQQAIAIERLKLAASLAHDLAPAAPPLIQTVLGNGDFSKIKNEIRDYLGEWIRIADETDTVIAIKPHRSGAVSKPADAVWLMEQLGKPVRLRMVYDYSHYAFRNLTIIDTINESLPYVAHVAVKDAVEKGESVVFELAGQSGSIDFSELIQRLYAGGYQGDFNCEVSSMVSKQPNYDPVAAAQTCYRNMSQAFARAGVPRLAGIPSRD